MHQELLRPNPRMKLPVLFARLATLPRAQYDAFSVEPGSLSAPQLISNTLGGAESRACSMNEFRLFAHGEAFDVDAFLARTTLRPDYVWQQGDQRRYACVESRHPTSGVEMVLGEGRAVPYLEQEEIAIAYLKAHRDELRALARFPGADTFILGLQYHMELGGNVIGFSLGTSPSLMWHCLDIGVRPVYYVTLDRRHAWEAEGA